LKNSTVDIEVEMNEIQRELNILHRKKSKENTEF
jgi:hypothetical protein